MDKLMVAALEGAIGRLSEHAELVGKGNVDESTFRSFFLADLKRRDSEAKCQIEWHRHDLLVMTGEHKALIEFKFYFSPGTRTIKLDSTFGRSKGGPSRKNREEFRRCITDLQVAKHKVSHKYVVLVYESKMYAKSYDSLKKFRISSSRTIKHCIADHAVCKLIKIS